MRRKLLLPALAACSMLAISAPVASATTHKAHASVSAGKKASKALGQIKGVKKAIANIIKINNGQTSSIHDVDLRVDKVVATLAAITAGVPAIVDGLTALKTALEDPVTGLRALNLARPKFASITTSGTGATVNGATPGFNTAVRVGTGIYILNFGQDVSQRAPQLSISTPGFASAYASNFVGQILNCGASDTTKAACDNFLGAGNSNVNMALVNIEKFAVGGGGAVTSAGGADGATFTATEIAG